MTTIQHQLTVNYQNGRVTVTGGDNGTGDVTIHGGETDEITFVPGTGVNRVSEFKVLRSTLNPTPAGPAASGTFADSEVTVSWNTSGSDLVVDDANSVPAGAADDQVTYCVQIVAADGNAVWADPKLINQPRQTGN